MGDYKIGSFYYVFILKDFTLNLLSEDTRFSLVMLFDTFLSLMYEFYNILLLKNQRNIRLTRNHFIITFCLLFDFIINLFDSLISSFILSLFTYLNAIFMSKTFFILVHSITILSFNHFIKHVM